MGLCQSVRRSNSNIWSGLLLKCKHALQSQGKVSELTKSPVLFCLEVVVLAVDDKQSSSVLICTISRSKEQEERAFFFSFWLLGNGARQSRQTEKIQSKRENEVKVSADDYDDDGSSDLQRPQWIGTGCAKAKGHSLEAAMMMMVLVIVASMMRLFEGECFYASLIRISHRRTERKERQCCQPKVAAHFTLSR